MKFDIAKMRREHRRAMRFPAVTGRRVTCEDVWKSRAWAALPHVLPPKKRPRTDSIDFGFLAGTRESSPDWPILNERELADGGRQTRGETETGPEARQAADPGDPAAGASGSETDEIETRVRRGKLYWIGQPRAIRSLAKERSLERQKQAGQLAFDHCPACAWPNRRGSGKCRRCGATVRKVPRFGFYDDSDSDDSGVWV